MAKAIRNLLPRCYHQNGLLGPFSAGEHTGRGRIQTHFPRLDLSHSFMSHVRLDIFPLHPPNLPWLSLLTQSSFHFGQLQVMPPDRETTPTFPRSQISLFPAYPRLWSLTNEPRTIQGWRRLPLRRPTRFRGQLRTVGYNKSSCGPGQVTSLLEL